MDTIIFDMDDTLYDQAATFRKTCKKMLNVALSEAELNHLYLLSRKHSDALFDDQVAGKITMEEMHIRRIKDACAEIGIQITAEQALEFQDSYVQEQGKIELFDEVVELLDYLSASQKQLAVMTNGAEGHQAMKIKQLKLNKWIPEERLFISETIGHAKPSTAAFQFMEDKLGLKKENTVYVGDSFANDIVGAKQAGWHAVWMNHRQREEPEGRIKADKTVTSAAELYTFFREETLST
ncbi:hydrolase [Oceanobacillus oncorhynchi subsp. incaldanensis]|uniref:Pyrimidine 5'-nucleotidase YjjG n=2 Tax=Oceanobacillus TaxID=182709 RepID=A0A0A1MHG1_9BACI|nr:HAD family hydrolase [Oceanobacillus oncorhynchi]MDM8102655.1 HAD family hydrolase [Oceanobacillus oncorhynchi]UUI41076.1 HAD family hydrolase [Oceanobacillus oncorhynchi]GIO21333.1 hydrolase [Oceanobacillus oncorhynchi subsp. incaldanensis]CEI82528.1 Pyrimidine 5'-nucleotidase YjjG [Oceanobacillus oncorhynchi]